MGKHGSPNPSSRGNALADPYFSAERKVGHPFFFEHPKQPQHTQTLAGTLQLKLDQPHSRNCFCSRSTGNGRTADVRRAVRGSGFDHGAGFAVESVTGELCWHRIARDVAPLGQEFREADFGGAMLRISGEILHMQRIGGRVVGFSRGTWREENIGLRGREGAGVTGGAKRLVRRGVHRVSRTLPGQSGRWFRR